MRQLLLDFSQAPAPTFANFVHGANAELFQALDAAVRGRAPERVLYLWGESGAGRSHLLKALAHEASERGARYRPAAAADFAADPPTGILAIDDIEQLSEPDQVALFNAFNERTFDLLVVAASAPPREVALRRDLATRLATGLTYRLLPLTDAQKGAALAAHARTRGFALSEEVRAYLLNHARRDMGSLIAALDAIDRYSLETGRPVTVPLLKEAMA